MKTRVVVLWVLTALLMQACRPTITQESYEGLRVLLDFSKEQKKRGLVFCNLTAENPDGCIRSLSASFYCNQKPQLEEARSLFLDCMDDFLTQVNSDEAIRPYLSRYPFTPRDVRLGIVFANPAGDAASSVYVGGAYMKNDGLIHYMSSVLDKSGDATDLLTETYEQAQAQIRTKQSQ